MGVTEEAGKVVASAVEAMQSMPLAIALLLVNIAFIGFNGYILSHVAANANERNATQMDLIAQLVRDCARGAKNTRSPVFLPALPPAIPIRGPE